MARTDAALAPDPVDVPASGGLSGAEVERRTAAGQVNTVVRSSSRSAGDIVRANVLTRFNALVVGLAVVVGMVGDLIDLTFVGVMVLNSLIGIFRNFVPNARWTACRSWWRPTWRSSATARCGPSPSVTSSSVTMSA